MALARRPLMYAGLLVAALIAFFGFFAATAFAQQAGVTETPRTDTLRVTNGEVLDSVVVGNRVVLVGTFTQVQDAGGSRINQPYIAAYNADTGDFDPTFRPDVDNFVNAIATDGNAFYITGQFSNVDGEAHRRIAKIRSNGTVQSRFTASMGSTPDTLAVANGKVYVGGPFTLVNNQPRTAFAAVDSTTGALDNVTDFSFTGVLIPAPSAAVRWIEVSPDGRSLFLSHTVREIDGQDRTGIAKFDISANSTSLSTWRTTHFADNIPNAGQRVRRLAISPDGSYVVIVTSRGDNPPTNDVAVRFPTSGNRVSADWVSRHFDTVLGVAISDEAVFVGGHFQFQEAPGSTDPFPGGMDENFGFGGNQGPQVLGDEVVQREQLGALNPSTGKSLDWNPGSDSFIGVQSLTWSDRYGLLVGHDANRLGGVQIGRHAVFPRGSTPTAPAPTPGGGSLSCDATIQNGSATVSFSGDLGTSLQVLRNGAWAGTVNGNSTTINANNGDTVGARVRGPNYDGAQDFSCDVTTVGGATPTPGAGLTCAATFAGGSATVTFSGDLGTSLQVLRNGAWAGTVNGNSTTINANNGDAIGARVRGPNYTSPFQDIACSGGGTGPTPGGGGDLSCVASVGGGSASVAFSGDLGTSLQVLRNGTWAGTVNGSSITLPASNGDNFAARVRGPNYTGAQDIACSAGNAPAPQPGGVIDTRIISPVNGGVVNGGNVTLTGESEAPAGVARTRLTIQRSDTGQYLTPNGSFVSEWTPLDTDYNGNAQTEGWSYDVSLPFAGQYDIAVRTFDVNNQRDTTVRRSFVVGSVNNAPPELVINTPTLNGNNITLTGTATDDLGVNEVSLLFLNRDTNEYYRLDGTLGEAQRIQTTAPNLGSRSTAWSITLRNVPDGRWVAIVDARDTSNQRDRANRNINLG